MLNTLIVIKQYFLRLLIKKLLKMYIKIWERVNSLINIDFDSESFYGDSDKYIKAKIKSYGDKVNKNFQGFFFVCLFSIWVFFNDHSRITGLQGKGEGIS